MTQRIALSPRSLKMFPKSVGTVDLGTRDKTSTRTPNTTPLASQPLLPNGSRRRAETDLSQGAGCFRLMSTPGQSASPRTRYRVIGTLLMLPIGVVIAFVLVFVLALRGGYFPGEYLLVFIAIFAVLFVVRFQFRSSRRRYYREEWSKNEPVRILRERYARGEITAYQFHQMLRGLSRSRGSNPGEDSGTS